MNLPYFIPAGCGVRGELGTGRVVIIRFVASLALGVFLSLTAAAAATLTVDNVAGAWTNPVTNKKTWGPLTGTGTNTISWGIPLTKVDKRSNYSFNGGVPVTASAPQTFLIGSYTHENWTVESLSTQLRQADLSVNVAGMAGGIGYSLLSAFTFTHNESRNNAGCQVGTKPCGDLVTIAGLSGGSTAITVGSTIYTLVIDGFVNALGGSVVTSFMTAERQATTLYLQARLDMSTVPPTPVPLPASGLVLAAALGGIIALRRRKIN